MPNNKHPKTGGDLIKKTYTTIGNEYFEIVSYIETKPCETDCEMFLNEDNKILVLVLTEEQKTCMQVGLDKNNFIEI